MSPAATTVIIGPLTRAGRAIAELALSRGDDVILMARHASDALALSGGAARVLSVDEAVDLPGDGPVHVLVCALGPVHPDQARADLDSQAFLRDLDLVERLLVAAGDRRVGVVLISSVIALAPGTDRRYYGGWKCLVEQQLAETVRHRAPHATFSVVYPGRLVDGPARRSVPGLHTTYSRLAETVESLAAGPSRARLSGIDARLWMAVNGLKVMIRTVLPMASPLSGRALEQSVPANERYSRP